MKFLEPKTTKLVALLVAIHVIIRCIIAYFLEFGNDEVYYVKYVEFPDFSHFDHPIMVQIFGQISSLNTHFHHHFFYRLSSLVSSIFCIILIYKITSYLYSQKAAIVSVLLYMSSLYASIIAGLFFMPDATLSLFWLLAVFAGIRFFRKQNRNDYILFSVSVALALASKYQAIFLPFGFVVVLFLYQRILFRKLYLYVGFFIMILGLVPTLIWNVQHDFVSFSFHESRVGEEGFSFVYFLREIMGEIFYNNPFSVLLYVFMFVFFFKTKKSFSKEESFLLWIAVPLIVVSILISFATETLPHWSAPAYFSMMILAGNYVEKNAKKRILVNISMLFFFVLLILGFVEIQNGFIMNEKSNSLPFQKKGKHDFTQDMYGWKQVSDSFASIHQRFPDVEIIASNRWYPASHLDFYVSKKYGMTTHVFGDYRAMHEYIFIQKFQQKPSETKPYFFVESSNRSYKIEDFSRDFSINSTQITIVDTIPILRRNDTIRYETVYHINPKK